MKKLGIILLLAAMLSACGASAATQGRDQPVLQEKTGTGTAGIFSKPDFSQIKKKAEKKKKYPEVVFSGKCGKSDEDDVSCTMYRTGKDTCVLKIYGTGRMADFLEPEDLISDGETYAAQPLDLYYKFHRPWDGGGDSKRYSDAKDQCIKIEVGEGITSIGDMGIYGMQPVKNHSHGQEPEGYCAWVQFFQRMYESEKSGDSGKC